MKFGYLMPNINNYSVAVDFRVDSTQLSTTCYDVLTIVVDQ